MSRERILIACFMCKRRKRKCDGSNPCSNCKKWRCPCEYKRNYDPNDPTIVDLKANNSKVIQLVLEHSFDDGIRQQIIGLLLEKHEVISTVPVQNHLQNNDQNNLQNNPQNNDHPPDQLLSEKTFADVISKVLYRATDESNEYIGTFAMISMIKAIRKNLLGSDIESQPPIIDHFDNEVTPVLEEVENGFIEKFFSLAHNRSYFLDGSWFAGIRDVPNDQRSDWELFCFNMALGIGCRLTELLKSKSQTSRPEIYLRRALKLLLNATVGVLQQIQTCVLISVFISRNYHLSFHISSWELVGIAMRKLIQHGYHRKQAITLEQAWDYEFKKRLFWSVYNFEKLLSLSLGRPFSSSDNFIDLPYPLSFETDEIPNDEDIYKLYQLQLLQEQTPDFVQEITAFTTLINTTKVRQIESRIHLLLYSVNESIPVCYSFDDLYNEIETWYKSLPSRSKFNSIMNGRESYDFFELLYHRVRLILFLPIIMKSSSTERDQLLDQACLSAGGICTSYINLHRDSILEFSIVALHTTFLAGVTMVYYLRNKGEPNFINIKHDIGACSRLLFIFSQRWNEAKPYRELFDQIFEQTEQFLHSSKNTSSLNQGDYTFTGINGWNDSLVDKSQIINYDLDEDFWDKVLVDLNSVE